MINRIIWIQSQFLNKSERIGIAQFHVIFIADIQLIDKRLSKSCAVCLHKIVELDAREFFLRFAVDKNLIIHNGQRIAGQTNTPFYIIFTAIHRPVHYFAVHIRIGCNYLFAIFIDQARCRLLFQYIHNVRKPFLIADRVIIGILDFEGYGVSRRKVKHYNVVSFYLVKSFQTAVFHLWFLEV